MKKLNEKISIVLFAFLVFLSGCQMPDIQTSYTNTPNSELPKTDMNEINQTKEPEASYTLEASEPIITPIPSLSLEELVSMEISNPKIIIYKSKRKLYLYNNDEYLSSFDIGLGFSPVGAKTVQGDGKTPEGEYYICYKNPKSKFHLSIGLSYPNKSDAQRALDEGRISQKTYDKIASAIDNGKRPPWDTPLGGEIMIHGHGSQSDWTAGCIAVDDSIMDLLYKICDLGTPVIINE